MDEDGIACGEQQIVWTWTTCYMLDKTTLSYRWLLKGSDITSGDVMGHDHDECAPSEEFGRQCRGSCGAA